MDYQAVIDDASIKCMQRFEFLVEAHWSDMVETISSSKTVFLARLLLGLREVIAARFALLLVPIWGLNAPRCGTSVFRASLAAQRHSVGNKRRAHIQR